VGARQFWGDVAFWVRGDFGQRRFLGACVFWARPCFLGAGTLGGRVGVGWGASAIWALFGQALWISGRSRLGELWALGAE